MHIVITVSVMLDVLISIGFCYTVAPCKAVCSIEQITMVDEGQ